MSFLLIVIPLVQAQSSIHYIAGCESPGWDRILQSFSLSLAPESKDADVFIVCPGARRLSSIESWNEPGKLLVLEGRSEVAAAFGFAPSGKPAVEVRNVRDLHNPELLIVWRDAIRIEPFTLPPDAKVLATDRWTGIPLVASLRTKYGPVLWLAVSPGDSGYDRFPYLGNALLDAGFVPALRSRSLWAFFDSAYRQRVDLNYIAQQWSRYGIAALHVSAWQHWERHPERDAWLRDLIAACHQQGILVYAWFEFPHVSEQFWTDHPECREKTALGQDAQIDWRKLINLSDPTCAEPVRQQTRHLLASFDWDGVNLAEIYYESLHGPSNPARFTPMNDTIREQFQTEHGFDPLSLFEAGSPQDLHHSQESLRAFLDFRRKSIADLHAEWLNVVSTARSRPLHLVVTQIDDRFDSSVRDNLGADSGELLALMHQHSFTYLVEDPATVWHLGPARYRDIANAYIQRTPYPNRLAIDINIFPRYQEVYPTRQQVGVELYQLVSQASRVFPRVALYFEHTLAPTDLPLLASAAVPTAKLRRDNGAFIVESEGMVGVRWQGPALVDQRAWAAKGDDVLWLPPGRHRVNPGVEDPPFRLLNLNAELRQIRANGLHLELHYHSESRAIAIFNLAPQQLWIDGQGESVEVWKAEGGYSVFLPPGEHVIRVEASRADIPSQ